MPDESSPSAQRRQQELYDERNAAWAAIAKLRGYLIEHNADDISRVLAGASDAGVCQAAIDRLETENRLAMANQRTIMNLTAENRTLRRAATNLTLEASALRTAAQTIAQQALLRLMLELSESHWCAGWMDGMEYQLWEICTQEIERQWGQGTITPDIIRELHQLRYLANGWWIWDEEQQEEKFIDLTAMKLRMGTP